MLIEENEKKRQAQLANTAPVVHAPPVVQPAVQPGYVQPQGQLRAPGRRGAGRLRPAPRDKSSGGYAPQGQVVGVSLPARAARGAGSTRPWPREP